MLARPSPFWSLLTNS